MHDAPSSAPSPSARTACASTRTSPGRTSTWDGHAPPSAVATRRSSRSKPPRASIDCHGPARGSDAVRASRPDRRGPRRDPAGPGARRRHPGELPLRRRGVRGPARPARPSCSSGPSPIGRSGWPVSALCQDWACTTTRGSSRCSSGSAESCNPGRRRARGADAWLGTFHLPGPSTPTTWPHPILESSTTSNAWSDTRFVRSAGRPAPPGRRWPHSHSASAST